MAYYPDWATAAFPPEKIDFDRLDWIDFAFAVPDENFNLSWDGSQDAPAILNRLITAAHNKGKHVKLSVGGWTGSKYFSTACSNAANRQKLADNILGLYNQYHLDGIDIDWEYPGQEGNEGNNVSPDDSANYLAFLHTLRDTLPSDAKITAATMTIPFADSEGNPMGDVSEFAKVLDWILLMNYDTWGSSSNPGPNAPLNDECGNSTQKTASALAAVETWTKAGFPASQIVLGVPSYGYISRSSAQTLHSRSLLHTTTTRHYPRNRRPIQASPPTARRLLELTELGLGTRTRDSAPADSETVLQQDVHEHLVDPAEVDQQEISDAAVQADTTAAPGSTLVTNEDGGTDNGQVQFRDLVGQGVLRYIPASDETEWALANMNDTTLTFGGREIQNSFTGALGFTRRWDHCSGTPYLTSGPARQVITYDDPQSLEMKAMFAKEAGLLGVNMFDVHGDTDHWDLTDSLRRGLGLD